ncbi:MAG: S1 RNA-binding domain-containing protein [Oscillospiraceae bacterium]|nr:S1 RNA-binding domain-containing protein [Oscillospiraceae bacterium]
MSLSVGSIVEGKVTGITNFGVFVELPENKTGMVHISEVASVYVKEIKDFVTVGQMVKVKVMTIGDDGKISLSIKRAQENAENAEKENKPRPERSDRFDRGDRPERQERGGYNRGPARKPYTPSTPKNAPIDSFDFNKGKDKDMSFEDMMNKFKQTSDDKMSDLKKFMDVKRGANNRKAGK